MAIIDGFIRTETLALTETTSNRLQYLEKTGLIIPQRIGESRKPTVVYTHIGANLRDSCNQTSEAGNFASDGSPSC